MFVAGIEQEPRAGFDDAAQAAFRKQRVDRPSWPRQIRLEGIERVMIEREGDAAIAQLGQDRRGRLRGDDGRSRWCCSRGAWFSLRLIVAPGVGEGEQPLERHFEAGQQIGAINLIGLENAGPNLAHF